MPIDKVKFPNGETEDIRDSRISGVDSTPTSGSANLVTSGGVKTALVQAVAGLGVAIEGKEDVSNKVTSLSSSSTDTEYPSAKCVYDAIQAGGGGMNASVSGRVLTITGVTVNNRNLII